MRYLVPVFLLGSMMFVAVFIGRYGSLDPCNMVRQEMLIQGRLHGGRTGEAEARSMAKETFDPFVQSGAIGRGECALELATIWTTGLKLPRQVASEAPATGPVTSLNQAPLQAGSVLPTPTQ